MTETTIPTSLAAALVALQADLPKISKGKPAVYGKYADLAEVSAELLPRLSGYGLAWSCMPGYDKDKWGLHLELMHVSGDSRTGFWEITATDPQKQGSAITYARRYGLCAATGCAPEDEDDDGQAASRREPARPEPEQDQRSDDEKADAWVAETVALALDGTDLEKLNQRAKHLVHSTLKDRDVSHLVTAADRTALERDDTKYSPETVFTLWALVDLAKEHIGRTGRAVRAPQMSGDGLDAAAETREPEDGEPS